MTRSFRRGDSYDLASEDGGDEQRLQVLKRQVPAIVCSAGQIRGFGPELEAWGPAGSEQADRKN